MPRNTPRTKNVTMPDLSDRFPAVGSNPPGLPPDGYVITYNAADGYYYPKATSKKQLFSQPSDSFGPSYNVVGEDVVLVQSHTGTFTVNLPDATATTIAVGSDLVNLPQVIINVASTTGFLSSGTITVTTDDGPQSVTYTGTTPTSFTGCAGGTGTMHTGGSVIALAPGTKIYIKDYAGVAQLNPIDVVSVALIDGFSPHTINTNYGAIEVLFNGSTWSILSKL